MAVRGGAVAQAALLAMAVAMAMNGSEREKESVSLWGRFEVAVEHVGVYEDPYADATLRAEFVSPSGRRWSWWGFYDGGRTWRVRFMPNVVGRWRYRLRFDDESAAGREGSFEVLEGQLPGMITALPSNPIWFGYSGGQGMLLRAFHVGDRFFAENFEAEKRERFLDYVQEQGYNALSVASHYLNRDAPGRGEGWDTPELWPLQAGEYEKLEEILDDLAARGLMVFPFAGFFGQRSAYPRDPDEQERYIRYTLARLAPYWNVMLNVAGPEPNGKFIVWMESEEVDRLGRLIQKLDPFGHLLSVHNETGDDEYKHASWTNYGILQGPKTVNRQRLLKILRKNHHWAKPLFAQETLWSGNPLHLRKDGGAGSDEYSPDDIRKNALMINFNAAALCYADNDGLSSTGFSGELDLDKRRQEFHDILKGVWDYLESERVWEMKPDYAVATSFGRAGEGHDETVWRVALREGDERFLAYFDESGEARLTLPPGKRYSGAWIDCRGFKEVEKVSNVADGWLARCPKGGDDWILRLEETR